MDGVHGGGGGGGGGLHGTFLKINFLVVSNRGEQYLSDNFFNDFLRSNIFKTE